MRISPKRNRVQRIHHWTKSCQNGPGQNTGHLELDSAQKDHGNSMLPRVLQLLPGIYRWLQQDSQVAILKDKEGMHRQLRMGRQRTTSIRRIEDKIHHGTGTDLLQPSGTNQDRNRRLKIHLLRYTVTTMSGGKMEASGIPIQDNVGRRMQL